MRQPEFRGRLRASSRAVNLGQPMMRRVTPRRRESKRRRDSGGGFRSFVELASIVIINGAAKAKVPSDTSAQLCRLSLDARPS